VLRVVCFIASFSRSLSLDKTQDLHSCLTWPTWPIYIYMAYHIDIYTSCTLKGYFKLKKKTTDPDPDVYLISSRGTNHQIFFLEFCLVRFWAFLGKGSPKTPQKHFYKKSMSHVENFSRKNRQNFRYQFFLDFFCVLSRFRVFLSNGSSKHNKKRFVKTIVSKSKKNRQKIPNRFFLDLFYHVFLAFLGEGSSKTRLKKLGKKLTNPGTFSASEEPTNHVGVRRFFLVPLVHAGAGKGR
jgi:hypothetical protein